MAGDPLSTLGPSDSGFLNAFLAPNPPAPLESRVGDDLAGGDSVFDPDPDDHEGGAICDSQLDAALAFGGRLDDGAPIDHEVDLMLKTTPLPAGLMARLHRALGDG